MQEYLHPLDYPLQKKSQVSVGGASMRSELFGQEMVTSEDHV